MAKEQFLVLVTIEYHYLSENLRRKHFKNIKVVKSKLITKKDSFNLLITCYIPTQQSSGQMKV